MRQKEDRALEEFKKIGYFEAFSNQITHKKDFYKKDIENAKYVMGFLDKKIKGLELITCPEIEFAKNEEFKKMSLAELKEFVKKEELKRICLAFAQNNHKRKLKKIEDIEIYTEQIIKEIKIEDIKIYTGQIKDLKEQIGLLIKNPALVYESDGDYERMLRTFKIIYYEIII